MELEHRKRFESKYKNFQIIAPYIYITFKLKIIRIHNQIEIGEKVKAFSSSQSKF